MVTTHMTTRTTALGGTRLLLPVTRVLLVYTIPYSYARWPTNIVQEGREH